MLAHMARSREVVVAAVAALVSACASSGAPGASPSGATPPDASGSPLPYPTAFSSELLGPMGALEECPEVEQTEDLDMPAGLLLPDRSVLQSAQDAGDLIQVLGYVPLTPVQLLDHYLGRDEISIITLEHEQFESQTLYETADHRVFVKAQVACATVSNFVAVIADAEDAAEVPVPSGAPTR